jgi:Flp pilus assembly protein TadD
MNFEKGVAHYKEGNFEAALTIFHELILQERENPTFYLYRGRILTRLGKGLEALADFDVLIQLEPYNTDYISDRAVVLHLLGRNEEAIEELDRAANLDPNNPYRYSSRAYLKDRIGDLAGAIADYEKAIELDPEDAVAYNNLGLVEEKMGRNEKALQNFSKADALSGYPPKKEPEQVQSSGSTSPEKREEITTPKSSKAPRLTASHCIAVVKGIFTEGATRKEFLAFLTGIFVKKGSKNS